MAVTRLRMDDELAEGIDAFADKHDLNRSEAMRILLGAALHEPAVRRAAQETVAMLWRAQSIGINKLMGDLQQELPQLIKKARKR
jgi:metal-responsive CopG/Arc/MetJ family transcriptional regulator